MSRITGSDAKALMEAYAAVYVPQEEVVEEVVEDVEQLDEQDVRALRAKAEEEQRQKQIKQSEKEFKAGGGQAALNIARSERRNLSRDDVIRRGHLALKGNKEKSALDGKVSYKDPKKLSADAAKDLKDRYPQNFRNSSGDSGTGSSSANVVSAKNIAGQQQKVTVGRKYGATFGGQKGSVTYDASGKRTFTADKPETAKTEPVKPAIGKLGNTSFERRTPTSTELKAAQAARASGAGPEKALQAAKAAGAAKVAPSVKSRFPATNSLGGVNAASSTSPTASGSVAPATAKLAATPKPTPVAPNRATGSKKPGSAFEQFDAYDVVLEYLLDNGHADTVDEAHYVMMEMDGETIANIVEGSYEDRIAANNKKYDRNRKRAAQRAADRNAARDAGKTGAVPGVGYVTPRRESETYRDSAGVERHKSGAKMPKKDSKDMSEQVLEHLVAEGYADTEEAALEIMANMSEEWKQSIVEGDALRNTVKKLEAKRDAMNANKPGSANTAAPGKQSVGAATYKAYQRLRGV